MSARQLLIHVLGERQQILRMAVPEVERFVRGNAFAFDPDAPDYQVSRRGNAYGLALKGRFAVRNTSKWFTLHVGGCFLGIGLDDRMFGRMTNANWCGPLAPLQPGETGTTDVRFEVRDPEHAQAIGRALEANERTRVSFAIAPSVDSTIRLGRHGFKLNGEALAAYQQELQQGASDLAVMRAR